MTLDILRMSLFIVGYDGVQNVMGHSLRLSPVMEFVPFREVFHLVGNGPLHFVVPYNCA